ncbi:hypothetical protein AVEN_15269-1 [Araneus ventricosus]|uniref:CCHC-type domain-containing protein n=2 Tax=Araneus ventricosus TaxID=182803 RepID=A0A4Y2HT56_ARAVE|nr:hypothetical protein AVEN_8882-1 [Araneus ventricosus]GBM68597.1 hypothetical protein AVEN_15269-1 [Araneus ventricosus]
MPEDTSSQTSPGFPLIQPVRTPSTFHGEGGENPTAWLKEYERIAKFNRWDDTMCLANAYFFLNATARTWYENNEEELNSWEKFQEQLKIAFGSKDLFVKQAEQELKCRAQKTGESTQSYIQSVLELCLKVNPSMSESDRVSHLMKGIAEDMYQSLLVKDINSTSAFITECQRIEQMNQRRITKLRFARLPNVVPMASVETNDDLVTLVRRIVREEVHRLSESAIQPPSLEPPSFDEMIREEVQNALCPVISSSAGGSERTPTQRRPSTYSAAVRRPRRPTEPSSIPRQTDIWRTDDNRPVCFHCGRPGHVIRYCRDRRAIFDAHRNRQATNRQPQSQNFMDEFSRQDARELASSTSRGRSPARRYRSPSPYGRRRSSRSPSLRNEEN